MADVTYRSVKEKYGRKVAVRYVMALWATRIGWIAAGALGVGIGQWLVSITGVGK